MPDYTLFPVPRSVTDGSAASAYSVSLLPATQFIDCDGNPAAHAIGMTFAEALEQGISMIIGEN